MKRTATSRAHRPVEATVAVLSYVADQGSPNVALGPTDGPHVVVSTLHVQLGASDRLQVMVLRGSAAELRAFAGHVISQPGVRHGNLHVVSDRRGAGADADDGEAPFDGRPSAPGQDRRSAAPLPSAQPASANGSALLTLREIEVLGDAALGMTAQSSAKNIGISPHTVNAHRRTIIKKLGTENLPAAVALALRSGLIK